MILLNYPGELEVKLIGLQADVDVRCVLIGECRYRCCYTADRPGMSFLFQFIGLWSQ